MKVYAYEKTFIIKYFSLSRKYVIDLMDCLKLVPTECFALQSKHTAAFKEIYL